MPYITDFILKSRTDEALMRGILQRIKNTIALNNRYDGDFVTLEMDLIATHLHIIPLDLSKLLDSLDADFAHDINGIAWHIDRGTGTMCGHFSPRCAKRVNYVRPDFIERMNEQIELNKARKGEWKKWNGAGINAKLLAKTDKLTIACNPTEVTRLAADLANYAMKAHELYGLGNPANTDDCDS